MTERDYKKEYREYGGLPEKKKNRAKRNAARRQAEKEGKVRKGDGKEVDHKTPIRKGGGNGKGNLQVKSAAANRGWRKGKKGYD